MELTIKRTTFARGYTEGILYANGVRLCDTLEPTDRALEWDGVKVRGRTAIPLGSYPITLGYSPRFRRTLPFIGNVPGYTGVRIHSGNTPDDTEGCVLVGVRDRPGTLVCSAAALANVIRLLNAQRNIRLTITR